MSWLGAVNLTLYFLVFGFSFLLLTFFVVRRSWLGMVLTASFLLRAGLAVVLDSGLKYLFVIDSLAYEYKAWLLAQKWMTTNILVGLTDVTAVRYNLYELLLSWFFLFFGHDPLLANMANSLVSVLTIYLIYRIQIDFIYQKEFEGPGYLHPAVINSVVLAAYPSFLIWSVSNLRDPIYFFSCIAFLYFFLFAFSPRSRVAVQLKMVGLLACAAFFYAVLNLRPYVNELFLVSIGIGVTVTALSRRFRIRPVLMMLTMFLAVGAYAYQFLAPLTAAHIFAELETVRIGFANLNLLDNVTRSSFALDRSFHSVTDVLLFMPSAVGHYFFGPFPWEVVNAMQAFSLIETAGVYLLVYPVCVGIRRAYERARFETVTLLSFVVCFSIAQSLAISNMGTIFRHRTLVFLVLSIFLGEGLYEIAKKNYPGFFKT